MESPRFFNTLLGQQIPLPVFFPDATRAVLKTLDSQDIKNTHTPGVLINTFHLLHTPGQAVLQQFGGVRPFMNWSGGAISDSGGFQVMSLAKADGSKKAVTDEGVRFKFNSTKKVLFTPKDSIELQSIIGADMIVVLDDFTHPNDSHAQAKITVERTIKWAKESKQIYERIFQKTPLEKRPYLLGVVQGGEYLDLRQQCTEALVNIGFDGLGYGGWPLKKDGTFNLEVAQIIRQYTPANYLLYGLGIGKPQDIVNLVKIGWHIFDCVLPSRDARHGRLYVYNADTYQSIDVNQPNFYSFYTPNKDIYLQDDRPVSTACNCLLCHQYSRGYLCHLYKINDLTAGRLATIHNLRTYSILMEKLREISSSPLNY